MMLVDDEKKRLGHLVQDENDEETTARHSSTTSSSSTTSQHHQAEAAASGSDDDDHRRHCCQHRERNRRGDDDQRPADNDDLLVAGRVDSSRCRPPWSLSSSSCFRCSGFGTAMVRNAKSHWKILVLGQVLSFLLACTGAYIVQQQQEATSRCFRFLPPRRRSRPAEFRPLFSHREPSSTSSASNLFALLASAVAACAYCRLMFADVLTLSTFSA